MSLDDQAYDTLTAIVGEPWVERAPCVLDTYAYYQNPETMNADGSQWLPRPAAVVPPQSPQEIQVILRFCSRTKYMAKPISTGFHTSSRPWAAVVARPTTATRPASFTSTFQSSGRPRW